jgi:aminoglycoside 6-adenylyltransferase
MRSEEEMLNLIVGTAQADERIRAVIMNGSRLNPNAPRDPFQDYDIVYIVADVAPFRENYAWISRFGELMILQMPENIDDPPPANDGAFAYLMQFADGNRIDLSLYPLAKVDQLERDSLSLLLLDKDGIIEPFPPASDRDYMPKPPTAKAFADCCNEFWWVSPYVAKGLWREEILYARYMLDQILREQLLKMLAWHIGVKTHFSKNPGKYGKYYRQYLEPELWNLLLATYTDASYESTWQALHTMGDLFRPVALQVAEHFGFDYPHGDDQRVSAHLKRVQSLPRNATEIY